MELQSSLPTGSHFFLSDRPRRLPLFLFSSFFFSFSFLSRPIPPGQPDHEAARGATRAPEAAQPARPRGAQPGTGGRAGCAGGRRGTGAGQDGAGGGRPAGAWLWRTSAEHGARKRMEQPAGPRTRTQRQTREPEAPWRGSRGGVGGGRTRSRNRRGSGEAGGGRRAWPAVRSTASGGAQAGRSRGGVSTPKAVRRGRGQPGADESGGEVGAGEHAGAGTPAGRVRRLETRARSEASAEESWAAERSSAARKSDEAVGAEPISWRTPGRRRLGADARE